MNPDGGVIARTSGARNASLTVVIQKATAWGTRPCHPGARNASLAVVFSVLVILTIAAGLRFGGVTRVGIRFDDESWYASDARLWYRCALVVTDTETLGALFRGDKQTIHARMADVGLDFNHRYRKPCLGYTFLGAGMMFLVGDRPAALLVTNALFGTLTVLALYLLGAQLFNRPVGLCATFLLAVSPYHLLYCRSALTEATTGFFIVLGVLFWAWGRQNRRPGRRAYLFSGMALGYAITCHYRSAFVPILLLLTDLLLPQEKPSLVSHGLQPMRTSARAEARGSLSSFRRMLWLPAGVLVPIVAFEMLFRAARAVAGWSDGYFPVPTYLEAGWDYAMILRGRLGFDDGAVWNPDALSVYAGYFTHWHGAAAAVLLAAGLLVSACGQGAAKGPAVFVLASLGILLMQRYTVARAVSAAIPFACLCIVVGIHGIVALLRVPRRAARVVMTLSTLALSAPAMAKGWELFHHRSGIEDACAFLSAHSESAVALPMDIRKYALYLERSGIRIIPVEKNRVADSPAEVIEALRGAGVRWMVTDPQHWHCRRISPPDYGVFSWWQAMEAELRRSARPAAEFPHLTGFEWEFLSEAWGLTYLSEMIERGGGAIRVYDLLERNHSVPSG